MELGEALLLIWLVGAVLLLVGLVIGYYIVDGWHQERGDSRQERSLKAFFLAAILWPIMLIYVIVQLFISLFDRHRE